MPPSSRPWPRSLLVASCGAANPTAQLPTAAPPASATPAASATASSGVTAPPSSSPGPAGSDANDATYAAIEAQVIKLRGLQPTSPVSRNVLDAAGLRALVTGNFNADNPAAYVMSVETLYKELLLMPQDASLTSLFVELYSTQAVGLYDDKTRQLYVVSKSGSIGPVEKVIYAHEYTHALQDQVFGIRAVVGDAKDQTDRTLARTTLVEGDAYLTMGLWAQANLTPAELAQVGSMADPASEAALAKLPEIVKQQLLFPATSGIGLAVRDYTQWRLLRDRHAVREPAGLDRSRSCTPISWRPATKPVAVSFPADLATQLGKGWSVGLQDTMGEEQLRILLQEGGSTSVNEAAAGWAGDRVILLEAPGGATVVVLDVTLTTDAAAGTFASALDPLVAKLTGVGADRRLGHARAQPRDADQRHHQGRDGQAWRTSSAWPSRRPGPAAGPGPAGDGDSGGTAPWTTRRSA